MQLMVNFHLANLRGRDHEAGYRSICDDKPTERYRQQSAGNETFGRVAGFDVREPELLHAFLQAQSEQQHTRDC